MKLLCQLAILDVTAKSSAQGVTNIGPMGQPAGLQRLYRLFNYFRVMRGAHHGLTHRLSSTSISAQQAEARAAALGAPRQPNWLTSIQCDCQSTGLICRLVSCGTVQAVTTSLAPLASPCSAWSYAVTACCRPLVPRKSAPPGLWLLALLSCSLRSTMPHYGAESVPVAAATRVAVAATHCLPTHSQLQPL